MQAELGANNEVVSSRRKVLEGMVGGFTLGLAHESLFLPQVSTANDIFYPDIWLSSARLGLFGAALSPLARPHPLLPTPPHC